MKQKRFLADIEGVVVGHATDSEALTGCTAVLFPQGAVAAHVAVGVASGSRELDAFSPRHLVEHVHGVCLSGGSAFGLAAASGVARRLDEAGIGHKTSAGRVPIVAGAVVYDLNLGDAAVRPDESMGYAAADAALRGDPAGSGNLGAGSGTSVGKMLGLSCATKTGVGQAVVSATNGLEVGALVVLNAVGDVLNPTNGKVLAGARKDPKSKDFIVSSDIIRAGSTADPLHDSGDHNTTLVVVATNAGLDKVEAQWVAEQASVALARLIDPPFTRHDGDVLFCASLGTLKVDPHRAGVLARDAVAAALLDAVTSAQPAGGLPSADSLAG